MALPINRLDRNIRMAFINTKAQVGTKNGGIWPLDTGTLRAGLTMVNTKNGYKIYMNTSGGLGEYIDFVDPASGSPTANARNAQWWDNVCKEFISQLAGLTGGTLTKL